MNIVAFDLSLSATGYAASNGTSGVLSPPKTIAAGGGMRRLQWIRFTVLQLAAAADLVVLEGYAFAAQNQAHQLGELGGVVRIALADRKINYVDVTPSSLKMFATGKGNAPKNDVLGAAIRKLGFSGNDHNEADALWLLEMARVRYVAVGVGNEAQRRALEKIAWPARSPTREATDAQSRESAR